MRNKRGKRGDIQISFGMIFSIILIIAFVAVAIYAIIYFLNLKKCADVGLFKTDLQEDIDRAWNSDGTTGKFSASLPANLDYACFIDLNKTQAGEFKEQYDSFKKYGLIDANMFFYPIKNVCKGQIGFNINHINITEITKQKNPSCFINDGKVLITVEKNFYDSLVNLK